MALVACPFCREMFETVEATHCPVCGMELRDLGKLPPSIEALDQDGVSPAPATEALPLTYLGRGKGALAALALVGLALFYLPWVRLTLPELTNLSGFDLARRLGWAWGPFVAWFVLIPTVLSRRSIVQMRGARVAASFLAAVPGVTGAIFLLRPPRGGGYVPLRFTFGWALYATIAVSMIGFVWALFRLGGRADDIRVRRGTSDGHILH